MLVHVRAETRRTAFELNLADEAAFYKRIETVINRRVGNLRHLSLGADENLLGGRVIALVEQHVIDLLPLRREPETAGVQPCAEFVADIFLDRAHDTGKIYVNPKRVKI